MIEIGECPLLFAGPTQADNLRGLDLTCEIATIEAALHATQMRPPESGTSPTPWTILRLQYHCPALCNGGVRYAAWTASKGGA
jgi:hypothetical protein